MLIAVGTAAATVAFLAFRPDTIFLDNAVDESLGDAFVVVDADQETTTTSSPATPREETNTESTQTSTPTNDSTDTSATPTAIAAGEFVGIDHRATGAATVYEQDGKLVLRFEDDTDIQNGPDLFVWVLPTDEFSGGVPTEYIDLGRLKGNVGGQNYELPGEFDPDVDQLVLVWCKRFSTPFAAASLT